MAGPADERDDRPDNDAAEVASMIILTKADGTVHMVGSLIPPDSPYLEGGRPAPEPEEPVVGVATGEDYKG